MGGHLFVLRGDLTQLHCNAVLVPCDSNWFVVWDHWSPLFPDDRFGPPDSDGWAQLLGGGGKDRFTDVVDEGEKWVRLVVTADDERYDSPEERARWVSEGVVAAIEDLSTSDIPPLAGRVKPLIGLPLVGTGAGGFEATRGVLIEALLPDLQRVARKRDVDVALVLIDGRDHAAVQAVRGPKYWNEFENERPHLAKRLEDADELGRMAAHGELSLFLGSGVSVPLGVPDWKTLLARVDEGKIEQFAGQEAPDIAQEIEEELGKEEFQQRIVDNVDLPGVAPTHMLLAALSVDQSVTTNYDAAYERALGKTVDGECRVLTVQLALQPYPWLLKYHGCVTRRQSIVITRDDYTKLQNEHGALQSIVESLMLTSHLMFVGFSMSDADFLNAAKRVNAVRALSDDQDPPYAATVLALHPQAVMEHAGFRVVSMLEDPSDEEAARLLEIFLDRISWKATKKGPASSSYLLHPDYQDLFADDVPTMRLREALSKLADELDTDDRICDAEGWDQVARLLYRLGARESEQS